MKNAPNFVLDDAEISFANYDEMRAFVEEREKNTEWLEQGVRELVFGALHEEPLCAPVYADKMHVSTEAIEDTMAGAGLKLTVSSGTRPVGASAVASIINRAGLQAAGWKKLRNGNLESLKSVLNIVVCMFDRDNVVANTVVRDLDEEMRIIDGLDEFWNDHVLAHIPPEPLGTADGIISTLRRYGGPANPRADRVRLTGDELEELCRQCVEMSLEKARAKKMADEVDARCKELSIGLIAALGNATDGALTSADGTTEYQIRYRPRKAPKKVDFDMLQARYPDAFAACVSQEAEGGRTFGIKAIARN